MKFRGLIVTLFTVLLVGAGVAPALAQYPPSVGAGKVTRSEVKQCQCTQFSGDGFGPGSEVKIYDQNPDGSRRLVTTVVADSQGGFKVKVCFDQNSPEGTHTLIGRGRDARNKQREVRANVVVKGSTCFKKGDEVHGTRFARGDDVAGGAGDLPRTGTDTTVPALLLGFGLVVAGSAVVLVYRRRPLAVS